MKITGVIISWAVAVLMVFDAVMKFVKHPIMVELLSNIGYQESDYNAIGVLGLAAGLLYLIPRTTVLGLFMMTGYLGGALASNFRTEASPTSHLWFALIVLMLVWIGALLRFPKLKGIFSFPLK
ncbi:DoxX family protein [Reichenbachiella ulvae]|uniref:DoxX family protein n=1 Tax=Reichenbachiella ulvae TaxID=2980104 RepID=A0ABT3CV86_9BACT|nr:DoxX family protein [Reichenbachiella ulvae]MCV9387148.1 DoxX family protein [Reichenbachiella ulvae]